MTLRQKMIALCGGGAVACLMLLGACGSTSQTASTNDTKMLDVDGVQCVVYDSGSYAGGISCNWDAYNKAGG